MCQLLGMNSASPTDFTFSFRGFCRRGGGTDKHEHGWGVAIYQDKGIRCFHDTQPACQSPLAQFLLHQPQPIKTQNMMAHIRYATVGEVTMENVHPFSRELFGVPITFCHNGECPRFAKKPLPLLGKPKIKTNSNNNSSHEGNNFCLSSSNKTCVQYQPIGDTDSEAVFCSILNALRDEYETEGRLPPLPQLYEFLERICGNVVQQERQEENIRKDTISDNNENNNHTKMPTIFNFLLACGPHTLFAYSWPGARPGSKVWNGLHYIIRKPPFSTARLIDEDGTNNSVDNGYIDFSTVTTAEDRVAVITTKPLTSEPEWREVPKGKLIVFERGYALWSADEIRQAQASRRVQCSSCTTTSIPIAPKTTGMEHQQLSFAVQAGSNDNNCAKIKYCKENDLVEIPMDSTAISDSEEDQMEEEEEGDVVMIT